MFSFIVVNLTSPSLSGSENKAFLLTIATLLNLDNASISLSTTTPPSRKLMENQHGWVAVIVVSVSVPVFKFPQLHGNLTLVQEYFVLQLDSCVPNGQATTQFRNDLIYYGVVEILLPSIVAFFLGDTALIPTTASTLSPISNFHASAEVNRKPGLSSALLIGAVVGGAFFFCVFFPLAYFINSKRRKQKKKIDSGSNTDSVASSSFDYVDGANTSRDFDFIMFSDVKKIIEMEKLKRIQVSNSFIVTDENEKRFSPQSKSKSKSKSKSSLCEGNRENKGIAVESSDLAVRCLNCEEATSSIGGSQSSDGQIDSKESPNFIRKLSNLFSFMSQQDGEKIVDDEEYDIRFIPSCESSLYNSEHFKRATIQIDNQDTDKNINNMETFAGSTSTDFETVTDNTDNSSAVQQITHPVEVPERIMETEGTMRRLSPREGPPLSRRVSSFFNFGGTSSKLDLSEIQNLHRTPEEDRQSRTAAANSKKRRFFTFRAKKSNINSNNNNNNNSDSNSFDISEFYQIPSSAEVEIIADHSAMQNFSAEGRSFSAPLSGTSRSDTPRNGTPRSPAMSRRFSSFFNLSTLEVPMNNEFEDYDLACAKSDTFAAVNPSRQLTHQSSFQIKSCFARSQRSLDIADIYPVSGTFDLEFTAPQSMHGGEEREETQRSFVMIQTVSDPASGHETVKSPSGLGGCHRRICSSGDSDFVRISQEIEVDPYFSRDTSLSLSASPRNVKFRAIKTKFEKMILKNNKSHFVTPLVLSPSSPEVSDSRTSSKL